MRSGCPNHAALLVIFFPLHSACAVGSCLLQETVLDHSTHQKPASIGPPSQESCDTIQRPLVATRTHEPSEPKKHSKAVASCYIVTGTDICVCIALAYALSQIIRSNSATALNHDLQAGTGGCASPASATHASALNDCVRTVVKGIKGNLKAAVGPTNGKETALNGRANACSVAVAVDKRSEGNSQAAIGLTDGQATLSREAGCRAVSKLLMRQQLMHLCQHYPAARPTRGNLKQVYQFARSSQMQ